MDFVVKRISLPHYCVVPVRNVVIHRRYRKNALAVSTLTVKPFTVFHLNSLSRLTKRVKKRLRLLRWKAEVVGLEPTQRGLEALVLTLTLYLQARALIPVTAV